MKPTVAGKTDKPAAKSAKVFDISHPGKGSASSTARPVIVTNRPILQDPMVSQPEPLPSAPKLSPAESKVKIQPLDMSDDQDDSVTESKPDKAEKSARNGDKTIAELAAEAIAGKAAEKQAKEAAGEPDTADSASKDAPAASDKKDEPAAEPETPQSDDGSTESSDDEPESSDDLPVEDSKDAKETAKLEAAAKKLEAIEALADSRQYFLPINTVERRRSKIVSLLGLVLIMALGLLLFDLLLDVGFIRINGLHPVTHFFSA